MSLKENKKKKTRKNPPPSFVLKPSKTPGHVVMFEKDEEGSLGPRHEGMEFRKEDLEKRPIDTLTHELSEREIHRSMEEARESPFGRVTRYSKEGEFDVPIKHAMVAHHTESGMFTRGNEYKRLTPEEFEKFFQEGGNVRLAYPKVDQYRDIANAIIRIAQNAKTKTEFDAIVERFEKLKEEARGNVPPAFIDKIDKNIAYALLLKTKALG